MLLFWNKILCFYQFLLHIYRMSFAKICQSFHNVIWIYKHKIIQTILAIILNNCDNMMKNKRKSYSPKCSTFSHFTSLKKTLLKKLIAKVIKNNGINNKLGILNFLGKFTLPFSLYNT